MRRLEVVGLPAMPSEAAAAFHAEWVAKAAALLDFTNSGGDLGIVFPPADHTHTAWRLAVVQSFAREFAPWRVNAVASDNREAIDAALAYLATAPGLTGQYLPLDGVGAGAVIDSNA